MTDTAHPATVSLASGAETPALRLVVAVLLSALLLQRLGLAIGASYLSIVGPIGLALAAIGLWRGILAVHRARLLLFTALVGLMIAGLAIHAALPDRYGADASWTSLIQFILVTSFGALVFAEPVDETRFFRTVNAVLLFIAVAGITQFALQFAGVRLFSFSDVIPANFLLEGPYNTVISIGDSGYDKANGMFLVEPSVFSQFMALAIIIEVLSLRRAAYLAVFAAALVASFSGTGWLMIMIFVVTAAISLGLRGVLLSSATLLALLAGVGFLALVFPSGFQLFLDRTSEISEMGSSGHLRFVTPWWLAGYVLSRTPWAALYGLGPGFSDHLSMRPVWDYNLNPPVKITLEYGIPCFVLYLLFLLSGRKTRSQKALVAPILVLLLIDGGYSQFPPVLFPSMILIMMAALCPAAAPAALPAVQRGRTAPEHGPSFCVAPEDI